MEEEIPPLHEHGSQPSYSLPFPAACNHLPPVNRMCVSHSFPALIALLLFPMDGMKSCVMFWR